MRLVHPRVVWLPEVLALFAAACSQIIPTPDDFPPPPSTPIVELPTPAGAPTVAPLPRLHMILPADMEQARSFFLMMKVAATAGDDRGIAYRVRYPIGVRIRGQAITIGSEDEFILHYRELFNDSMLQALSGIDEQDLSLTPDGIRAGNGLFWFNLFCMDLTCSRTDFLITQINN